MLGVLVAMLNSCNDVTDVDALKLGANSLVMQVGEQVQLEVIITPLSSTVYNSPRWKSTDENVVRVDSKGVITAVYAGECVVSVSCGEVEDRCVIKVLTPEFDIDYSKAYVRPVTEPVNVNANTYTLRLLVDELSFDTMTNQVEGNGMMFCVELHSSLHTNCIDTGVYSMAYSNMPTTFTPGELIDIEDKYYATGTFMGQYTDNGFAAIFVKQGSVRIGKEGENYTVKANVIGADGETITANYCGSLIAYGANAAEVEELTLRATNHTVQAHGTTPDGTKGIVKLGIECVDGVQITQYLIVPLSASGTIPCGNYKTADTFQNFTIINNNADDTLNPSITEQGERTAILFGAISVAEKDGEVVYKVQYRDSKSRIITVN